MHILAPLFAQIFEGFSDAYGCSVVTGKVSPSGKAESSNITRKEPVTNDLWSSHLSGKSGLGIIPINAESQCKFGAIDIDDYNIGGALTVIMKKIQAAKMPLVMTRTKSGGIHLWLFLNEWAPASLVQEKLMEMAGALGYGHSEIFPKQTQILAERGDLGSWINMPYFNGDDTTRYGYTEEHVVKMSAKDFILHVGKKAVSMEDLQGMTFTAMDLLVGGPPCLNSLVREGFPLGTRNNGLLNLGIYCKKAYPDEWEVRLNQLNEKYMQPPLTAQEVVGAIKSLKKKEYSYTCKSQPIQQYCNQVKCRQCAHGVGGMNLGMPKLGSLTKINCQPPMWFLEVEGGQRLELSTEELQSPQFFQKRCMQALNIMPIIAKRDQWQEIVQKLLDNVNVVEIPEEASPRGILMHYLEEFCTSRVAGKSPEELLLGKPFTVEGRTYFRIIDFLKFLDRNKFNDMEKNEIQYHLHEHGAKRHFFNIKGKGINVIHVAEFKKQTEPLTVPPQNTTIAF